MFSPCFPYVFGPRSQDIAWSDLLTEAVYSTHLREKPDQGPSASDAAVFFSAGWEEVSQDGGEYGIVTVCHSCFIIFRDADLILSPYY